MAAGTYGEMIKRLEEWGKKGECSPKFAEFYQRLFGIQARAEEHIGTPEPALESKALNKWIDSGTPLVSFDKLAIDSHSIERRRSPWKHATT